MTLPLIDFSLETLDEISKNSTRVANNKVVFDVQPSADYISQYFYPLNCGDHAFYTKGKFITLSNENLVKIYLNRMNKEVKTWYETKNFKLYDRVCKINKPLIEERNINTIGRFKHKYQSYDSFNDAIKENVEFMKKFYLEIWASGDKANYEFIMDWIANMCKGNRNQSLIYLKSTIQGIGKSKGTEFLMNNVIGHELSLISGASPFVSNFNGELYGKLFVIIEELDTSTKGEWEKISSNIKRMVTSDSIQYQDKYIKTFSSDNITNFIVPTNNEAFKDANGRRIYNADVSSKRKGDQTYWDELVNRCFNDEVGHAFYCLMLERDLTNYKSQSFPTTQSKKYAESQRLDPVYNFLKFHYIFPKIDINKTNLELYDEFVCSSSSFYKSDDRKDSITKITMSKRLRDIGINSNSSHSKLYYRVKYTELKQIAEKFKWFHEDDFEVYERLSNPRPCSFLDDDLVTNVEHERDELKHERDELKQKNISLQEEINKLKQLLDKKPDDNKKEINIISVYNDGLPFLPEDEEDEESSTPKAEGLEKEKPSTPKDKNTKHILHKHKIKVTKNNIIDLFN
jgi:hypothetical protein